MHTDVTDDAVRVAVKRDDAVDALDRAVLDAVDGAAGHLLLGGLEDEADGARRRVLREQRRGAEQHRRVRVVAAGVADALVRRGELEVGLLIHRQRVDVGAQRDEVVGRRVVGGGHVTDQAGADGETSHLEPETFELFGDVVRRRLLLIAQLGVGVQVAAPLDELVPQVVVDAVVRHGGLVCRVDVGLGVLPTRVRVVLVEVTHRRSFRRKPRPAVPCPSGC